MAKHNHIVIDFETGEPYGLALPREGGGSSTTPEDIVLSYDANCLETDSPKDGVYITGDPIGGRYQVTRVDIDSAVAKESIAFGIIVSKSSTTECVIVVSGIVAGLFSGLTPGSRLFTSTTGELQQGPPSYPVTGKRKIQEIAYAVGADTVLIQPKQAVSVLPV